MSNVSFGDFDININIFIFFFFSWKLFDYILRYLLNCWEGFWEVTMVSTGGFKFLFLTLISFDSFDRGVCHQRDVQSWLLLLQPMV